MKGFLRQPQASRGQVQSLREPSLPQIIRYKGTFDLNELYRIIHDWLVSRGFEVHEHKYKSIAVAHGAKERSFDWEAYKPSSEFVMNWIHIHFQMQDIIEIETIKDEKKVKLQQGRIFIRIQHAIELDWSERFAYKEWHQSLLNFMASVMYRKKIDTLWEDKLRFKCYELANIIKETLDMMTKGNEHYDVW